MKDVLEMQLVVPPALRDMGYIQEQFVKNVISLDRNVYFVQKMLTHANFVRMDMVFQVVDV